MNRRAPLLAPATALLLLFVVSADAVAAGELTSAAPVAIHGSLGLAADQILVHHRAFADGTLEGRLFSGRLTEEATLRVREDQPAPCHAAFEGRHEQRDVFASNGSRSIDQAQYALLEGALARLVASSTLQFSLTRFGEDADPEQTTALLGPNPYAFQTQQAPFSGTPDATLAPLFPTSVFAWVPATTLHTVDPFTLELYVGTLTVHFDRKPNAPTQTFTAGTTEEPRETTDPSSLPPGARVPCRVLVTRTYFLAQEAAVSSLAQDGLERPQAFWDGSQPGEVFDAGDRVPPLGYWDRERAEEFGDALETLLLPATVVSAPQLVGSVSGQARFEEALGSVRVGGEIHEAGGERVTLEGTFDLEPIATDDGRRMTSRIDPGVVTFRTDGAGPGSAFWVQAKDYGAVAAGGLALAGVAYAWPSLKFAATKWALFPLYARLRREDILENPIRDDILDTVNGSPGISASELGRRLSCGWGTLVYHLTVLERMRLISSAREGRHRRFFVQGRINYSDKGAVGLLANPSSRAILEAIQEQPGIIQRDLGRMLGITPGTVAWHVDRLAQAGLVLREEEGRVVRYYPSAKLLELAKQLAA